MTLCPYDAWPNVATQDICRRCKTPLAPGIAIQQGYTGQADFTGGEVVTMSAGGPGRVIDCMKCPTCGHSITGGGEMIKACGAIYAYGGKDIQPGPVMSYEAHDSKSFYESSISSESTGASLREELALARSDLAIARIKNKRLREALETALKFIDLLERGVK